MELRKINHDENHYDVEALFPVCKNGVWQDVWAVIYCSHENTKELQVAQGNGSEDYPGRHIQDLSQVMETANTTLKEDNMKQINFDNIMQVTLYECEIKGQLSDGHWENTEPDSHWEPMCEAKAKVVGLGEKLGCNFEPEIEYDFTELTEYLCDRMIRYVKTVLALPEYALKFDSHWKWEDNLSPEEKAMVDEIEYTEEDLIEDLSEMSRIVNKERG